MRLLFIKPRQIGDSLMLTPTLAAARQALPKSEIWVVVRRGCEGILAGCPAIDRILTVAAVASADRSPWGWWHETRQLLGLASVKFDFVFELGDGPRARWFACFCRAAKKYSVKTSPPLNNFWRRRFDGVSAFEWGSCHRVEKDFYSVGEFLPLPLPVPPLIFDRSRTRAWPLGESLADFAVLQTGTRQRVNEWHYEGWLEAGRGLLRRFSNLVISTGPSPKEVAEAERLRADLGNKPVCTHGQTSWAELADLLYRARLYVGPPTAAMHLAAACQCPAVGLFGPTVEDNWRPWQSPHRVVTVPNFQSPVEWAARFAAIKRRATTDILAADVLAACDSLATERC